MMKATGIVRKVDDLGRFVLPKELRDTFDIKERDPMEVFIGENNEIILKKYERGCIFCGEVNNVIQFKGRIICKDCVASMSAIKGDA